MSGIVVVGPLVVDVGTVAEDVGGGIVKVKVAVVASVVLWCQVELWLVHQLLTRML